MEKKTFLSISLSQEELAVILPYVGVKTLIGLDPALVSTWITNKQNSLLTVAERALISRGFLIPGKEHSLKLLDPVLALVGTCAQPEKTITLTVTFPDGHGQAVYFHNSRKMHVMHTTPISGIHQFIAVEDDQAMLRSMQTFVDIEKIPTKKPVDEKGEINTDDLIAARNVALKGKKSEAEKILSKSMSAKTSKNIAQALANLVKIISFNTTGNMEKGGMSGAILQSTGSLWLVHSHDLISMPPNKVSMDTGSRESVMKAFNFMVNF